MIQTTIKATKEQARCFVERRIAKHKPPPDLDQIRRALGWEMAEMQRNGAFRGRR